MRATVFHDAESGKSFEAVASEDFVLTRGRSGLMIIAGYIVRQDAHADLATLQVIPWVFQLIGDRISSYACPSDPPLLIQPRTYPFAKSLKAVLRDRPGDLLC
jgi:hypothetical protein